MKTTLTIIFISFSSICLSQGDLKIKQIDALVLNINTSLIPIQRDTLIQDYPEMGLKMITYLSMIIDDRKLLKYENLVKTTRKETAGTREMTTSSSFYYDDNKLIKVEEFLMEGGDKKTMDWYYSEDKALHYTLQSDKAADRATFLITLGKEMLKKVIK